MNEILECIKLIKMYAWEKYFGQKLLGKNDTIEDLKNYILYKQIEQKLLKEMLLIKLQ